MSAATDEDLVRAVRSGDTDSLGVLVSRWEQPLFRFVYRLLPRYDDARDICQETFLRILKSSDRFRDGSRFSTWMYQIALNLCRDQQRRQKRWGRILSADPGAAERARAAPSSSVEGDPGRAIERGEATRAVQWALAQIPAEQREVLILKEFEGLRFREIAEILGCPESTVKSRMYYGLDGVRRALERQGVREG